MAPASTDLPRCTSPRATTGTCDPAGQELQSVRSRLSQTIQDYLAACEAIQTAYSTSNSSTEREQALLAIDAELSAFDVEEASIRKARNILTDIRNRSKMVAPIYSLPSEVLARIFSWATYYCIPEPDFDFNVDFAQPISSPISLSAVCRRWRQVAINHRALWTCIDLGVCLESTGHRYHSPDVWVERSKGAPLYITIHNYYLVENIKDHPAHYGGGHPPPVFNRLLHFLTPLMPQVFSLHAAFSHPEQYMLNLLLDRWTMYGTVGRAKVLEINAQQEPALQIRPSNLNSTAPELARRYREFFQSLEVLELANTIPSWSEFTLCNLVRLDLFAETGRRHMTQPELVSVLASSPRLQQLKLIFITVLPSPGSLPHRIPLNELWVLSIAGFRSFLTIETVLGMINSGPGPLAMGIIMPRGSGSSPQQAITAICSFINRSNVTMLSVHSSGQCFASQLGPLPHVQTLVLWECHLVDVALIHQYNIDDPGSCANPCPINPELVLWPMLQSLYLDNCALEKNHVRQLVSLHPIKSLYMRGCYEGLQPRGRDKNTKIKSRTTCEEYVQLLSEVVPKVAYFKDEWIWPSLTM